MTLDKLLSTLFETPEPVDGSNMRRFLTAARGATDTPDPFERLVHVAMRADRRTAAAAAGHQAAILRLFPEVPPGAITAFCVSEEGGARPTAIQATLQAQPDGRHLLSGEKKWGTMSPDADTLFIAASIGTETIDGRERNQIRMVGIPADRSGIQLTPRTHDGIVSEMRIADLSLRDVEVLPDEVREGDGFQKYVKPFRLIEDVFGNAGTQIAAFGFGRRHDWPQNELEDLLALITQAWAISQTDMAAAPAVLAMAAYFRRSNEVWESLSDSWSRATPAELERWHPEVGLLQVAQKAREIGRERAWGSLQK
ncbi:MAG: acyl-CoA/acyl-ACP dehydrogenase [Candidatus Binatia bacterium]|nr:acyl-CoA/acyl-ACP dehydrogenase [Candidatus Binatia bacterium]